jgi:hypothetical protein
MPHAPQLCCSHRLPRDDVSTSDLPRLGGPFFCEGPDHDHAEGGQLLFGENGTLEERVQELEKDFETDANIGQIIQFVRERNRFGLRQPQRAVA